MRETGTYKPVCRGEKPNQPPLSASQNTGREGWRWERWDWCREKYWWAGRKKEFVMEEIGGQWNSICASGVQPLTQRERVERQRYKCVKLSCVSQRWSQTSHRDKGLHAVFYHQLCVQGHLTCFMCSAPTSGLASISKQPLCRSLSAWTVIILNYWKILTPDPMENCCMSEHVLHCNVISLLVT